MTETTERLQKAIAQAGIASRRQAEKLIETGHVKVNGETVTEMGIKVKPSDNIEVDGMPVIVEDKKYFLFYKPRGVITAAKDDKNRKVVTDFFENVPERLYPVGRLDYDTSGLLLMTNDGDFANSLMHPRYEVEKQYVAKVKGIPTRATLAPLKTGIVIEGRKTAPARFNIMSSDKVKKTAIVSLTIHEGMNHQVKLMLKAVGSPVMKLSRVSYGPITLEGMTPGDYRPLKPRELQALKSLTEKGRL